MCVQIRFANKQGDVITSVGGTDRFLGAEQPWGLAKDEVVKLIESGRWSFFVNEPTGEPPDRVAVRVVRSGGTKYLRTVPEGDPENNLTALPAQNPQVTAQPPGGLSSGLPGARTPRLRQAANEPPVNGKVGVFTTNPNNALDAPGPNGFPLLPATTVFVRFVAPFSNRYEVRLNGEFPLFEAPAGTLVLPDPLESRGWWALTHIGYVGPYNPTVPLQIDRDFTVYQMRVRLPDELAQSQAVSMLISQLSLNQHCLPPEDKSLGLTLELRSAVPVGGGGGGGDGGGGDVGDGGPAPTAVTSGLTKVLIGLAVTGEAQCFTTTQNIADLANAKITTVTNLSRDKNGDGIKFRLVEHRDKNGQMINMISNDPLRPAMEAGAAVGDFRDLFFNGAWKVCVTGLSEALLDSRKIMLEVAWKK